jgi:hypothetical protein
MTTPRERLVSKMIRQPEQVDRGSGRAVGMFVIKKGICGNVKDRTSNGQAGR